MGIATWSEWRTTRRLADEHARSDRQLVGERALSAAQIEEERKLAQEREQVAEAYAVQVTAGTIRGTPATYGRLWNIGPARRRDGWSWTTCLLLRIRGSYQLRACEDGCEGSVTVRRSAGHPALRYDKMTMLMLTRSTQTGNTSWSQGIDVLANSSSNAAA